MAVGNQKRSFGGKGKAALRAKRGGDTPRVSLYDEVTAKIVAQLEAGCSLGRSRGVRRRQCRDYPATRFRGVPNLASMFSYCGVRSLKAVTRRRIG